MNLALDASLQETISSTLMNIKENYSLQSLIDHKEKQKHFSSLSSNLPENIMDGASGILLLLAKSYDHFSDKTVLSILEDKTNELAQYCFKNPTHNYGFYTGRMGFVYLLLQLYKITKDDQYLQRSLTIIRASNGTFLTSGYVDSSLINGRSGALLVLLELLDLSQEKWLLEYIKKYVLAIINSAKIWNPGIYWNPNILYMQPPCSFAKGTSGIAYVLCEVAKFFNNESLFYLVKQVLTYENSLWCEETLNWPNFEKEAHNIQTFRELKGEYLSKNALFPSDAISWAHGAAGIGINRLKIAGCFDDNNLKTDVKRAFHKCTTDVLSRKDNSLFLGKAGIGCFFVELSKHNYEETAFDHAVIIAQQLNREDYTLDNICLDGLSGILGTHYFFLELLKKDNTSSPNILSPSFLLNSKNSYTLDTNLTHYKKALIQNHFPRTLSFAEQMHAQPDIIFDIVQSEASLTSDIHNICETVLDPKENNEEFMDFLNECYTIENAKFELSRKKCNTAEISISDSLSYEEANFILNSSDDALFELSVKINPNIVVLKTGWNWTNPSNNLETIFSTQLKSLVGNVIILKPDYTGNIVEIILHEASLIISLFYHPLKIKTALEMLINTIKSKDSSIVLSAILKGNLNNEVELFSNLSGLILKEIQKLIIDGVLVRD